MFKNIKCLIIANDIGNSAPGIVYETIIRELASKVEISLIAIQKRDIQISKVNELPVYSAKSTNNRLQKLLFELFGRNLFDDYWLLRQKKVITSDVINEHNIIISFISNYNYKSLLLGYYLSKKYKKKWIVYSVDAIPAPIGWSDNNRYTQNTRKFINKHLNKCDAFFSANQQMLHYQLSTLNYNGISGVLFTPIRSESVYYSKRTNNKVPVFLYTGGIYGPRRKEALLEGFRLFLEDHPAARLIFVGTQSKAFDKEYKDLIDSHNIILCKFTHDLTPYYEEASALIDINAYFDNDVFLSSKIVNYLTIKKPIVSITGLNSPSRNIFTDDPSIIHCKHDPQEIYKALQKVYSYVSEDWNERDNYIEKFKVKNAIKGLLNVIKDFGH